MATGGQHGAATQCPGLPAPGSGGHQPNATERIDDEPSSLIRTGTTTGGRSGPLGEAHLCLLLHEYIEHYHRESNHQGLDNQLLQRPPPPVNPDADVERWECLGGLLSFYYRKTA